MGYDSIRIVNAFKLLVHLHLRTIIMFILLLIVIIFASVIDLQADPFEQGSLRVSILVGSGEAFENDYTIIGLGAGYFLKDGLEFGLDGEAWLGGNPDIYKLSPQAKYILLSQSRFRPYVGAFYTHSFVENEDDLDSIGGRGGVYLVQDERWFVGVGAVYESYLDCDEKVNDFCDDIYPEITVSFTF
ncbi:MAG: hypothetical protein KJO26_07660 [Deltaproteobacteria bacterium]|nr:hypothetical protein [Deltaproteobacteria bacterium]